MDIIMTAVWGILCILAVFTCLKYPGKLYIYVAAGLAGAAIMAFLGAPMILQLILGVFAAITALLYCEAGIGSYFLVSIAIDLAIIVLFFLFFGR